MQKRTAYGIALAIFGLAVAPIIVFAAINNRSDLDRFLERRVALLEQLDTNVMNLPQGFEHVLPPQETSSFPPTGHIESVVRGGDLWYADNYSSYDLRIVAPFDEAASREILDTLYPHLSNGMNNLGFTSPKSGGPDWLVETRRAAHSACWRDSDHKLIVTLSVVVDSDSDSAHVTRYVHERFE